MIRAETRRLILALQFLTRLPTPQVQAFSAADLTHSAHWFPLVGLLIGTLLAGAGALAGTLDPWLGALLSLLVWVWVTGALHLDGLADMSDGLGAGHRDPARLLAAMRDPHVGALGVVALIALILSKLVLLMLLLREHQALVLLLIPAWARLGTLCWASRLPPLDPGMGERFAWAISPRSILIWLALLTLASALLHPLLLLAPAVLLLWWLFLHKRLGGMSGDALGAGVEVSETLLLAGVVVGVLA